MVYVMLSTASMKYTKPMQTNTVPFFSEDIPVKFILQS
jgi:hypothetical protein